MNAKRVNAAAGVIHASQEKGRQTAAGIAADLESACLLQSPETAQELAAYRALELADVDGRMSASCDNPHHPTWLRRPDDVQGCPWCETDKAHDNLIGTNLSLWEEEQETARLRLALRSAQRGRRDLRAEVAALRAERHSTNEALSDAAEQLRADRDGLAQLAAVRAERDQARAAVRRGLTTLRVWRDERETGPEAARLLYEVGAALTEEQPAADRSADRLTRMLAPTPDAREDEARQSSSLVALRQAALRDLPPGTRWRVIATDSESLTGVAPVCTAERSADLHTITDYPGGPKYDGEGVYDCCPWPQFETYSVPVAAYLVALLNADAEADGAS